MGQISLQVPQSGSPNSTEDPKVASDLTIIQTLVNGNVDQNNIASSAAFLRLAARSVSANTTAAAGDLVIVSGGNPTITLPAPTSGATVGVFVLNGAVAGGSPVTVTGAASSIRGVGLSTSGVTSILLGVYGAYVVLVSDGANWYIVAGQQDTGWVALTALSGFTLTVGTGYTASARLRGDMVELSGAVKNITGGTPGNSAWASLPASIPTPAQLVGVPAITGASVFVPIYIGPGLTPSNAVWVFGAVPNNGYVSLDGLRYRVS